MTIMFLFVEVLIFSPLLLVAITMLLYPRLWADRYARRSRAALIRIEAIQLRSNGAWRAFGVAIICVVIWILWYLFHNT